MKKSVEINENLIKRVVLETVKKHLNEDYINDIKISDVFFKLCKLTDEVGFTAKDWGELIKKCERQKMMRSFQENAPIQDYS